MSRSSLHSLGLVVIMAAVVSGRPAVAQGLLHKHAQRPLGVPMSLPGQQGVASAVSGSATAAVATVAIDPSSSVQAGGGVSTPGAAPGGPALVAIAPGADLGVDVAAIDPGGAVGDGMICVMPLPDGQPGHPHVFHGLKPGATDGSPGMLVGPPLGDPGVVDAGLGDIVTIMPFVDAPPDGALAMPVAALVAVQAGGIDHQHGDHRLMTAAANRSVGQGFAPAAADASAGPGAQARFSGLPNRAAGMRADGVPGSLPQARGLADGKGPAASSAPRATSAGTDARGVKQASASDAAKAGAGQPRLPAQAAAAPRWRDRLRFAWPTTK